MPVQDGPGGRLFWAHRILPGEHPIEPSLDMFLGAAVTEDDTCGD